jgi:Mg-chelatase subunit ChlD
MALLVVGGFACASVDADDRLDAGAKRDAVASAADSGPANALACAVKAAVQLDPQQADVLILLDRSGSMDTAFGSGTRYQAVASLLSDVVTSYAARVRFGYQESPGRQTCGSQALATCCASPPTVDVAGDNATAVVAAIAAAAPMEGGTPTAAALQAARGYYDALGDGVENRYVLLATDGEPNCTLAGTLASGTTPDASACADALAEVSALAAAGVRVIVLGVGSDLEDNANGSSACLNAMAHAGGAAASPGNPGYFAASDAEQLRLAVEQIFGGVARSPCSVRFRTELGDTLNVAVYLDGQQIPRVADNGWWLDLTQSPPAVHITGVYCDEIAEFRVRTVEARYVCPPCFDVVGCGLSDPEP